MVSALYAAECQLDQRMQQLGISLLVGVKGLLYKAIWHLMRPVKGYKKSNFQSSNDLISVFLKAAKLF